MAHRHRAPRCIGCTGSLHTAGNKGREGKGNKVPGETERRRRDLHKELRDGTKHCTVRQRVLLGMGSSGWSFCRAEECTARDIRGEKRP